MHVQRINNQQLKQPMFSPKQNSCSVELQYPNCQICQSKIPTFSTLITHSLFGKYSSSQNFYYSKQVDEILSEELCNTFVQFQQNNYLDDDEQYLKRQYTQTQFPKKIDMLAQYYKFHRNQPTWNDRGVQPLMSKYYNRVKDVDYKRIKSVLKKQQNISITTHNSFSSFGDSEYTKKSRYSEMLNQLNTSSNQSFMLLELCDKIGKALKKVKPEQFKGNYYSGQKKFQQFLKKQKKQKEIAKKKQQSRKQTIGFKKFKFGHKLQTRDDDYGLKQINFGSNHSIHSRNPLKYKQLSIEKTSANQTASRQEKSRRQKSYKNIPIKSSRGSLSKRSIKEQINSDITPPNFRQLSTINIGTITNANNLKTINQIYQATSSKIQINYDSKKNQRPSSSRLKYRSNSSHNLQTQKHIVVPENLLMNKKQINFDNKLTRTSSKKKILTSTTKISQINLQSANSTEKITQKLKERQVSQRILRTNSTGKLINQRQPINQNIKLERSTSKKGLADKKTMHHNTERAEKTSQANKIKRFGSQRNSVIENMLQKKLELGKKKPVLI